METRYRTVHRRKRRTLKSVWGALAGLSFLFDAGHRRRRGAGQHRAGRGLPDDGCIHVRGGAVRVAGGVDGMRKRALAAAAAMMMLAAVVANLLMLSTTAQPIEQDEAMAEKLTQTYMTHMPEPVIRQEEPERDMSAWTDAAAYIAKTVYGEAMVCGTTERAAVVWCILNRADDARDATPAGVIAVVTKPYQFHGYAADHPLLPELEELALDVIERWLDEKDGETEVGRVLPREYLFFTGDGKHNHFRTEWDGGQVWDWSLQSPYEE